MTKTKNFKSMFLSLESGISLKVKVIHIFEGFATPLIQTSLLYVGLHGMPFT